MSNTGSLKGQPATRAMEGYMDQAAHGGIQRPAMEECYHARAEGAKGKTLAEPRDKNPTDAAH